MAQLRSRTRNFDRVRDLAETIGLEDLTRLEERAVLWRDIPIKLVVDLNLPAHERLSERQVEIVGLQAEGLTVSEIATSLGVGMQTVKTHLKLVHRKLGTRTGPQTVARCIQIGYLQV